MSAAPAALTSMSSAVPLPVNRGTLFAALVRPARASNSASAGSSTTRELASRVARVDAPPPIAAGRRPLASRRASLFGCEAPPTADSGIMVALQEVELRSGQVRSGGPGPVGAVAGQAGGLVGDEQRV